MTAPEPVGLTDGCPTGCGRKVRPGHLMCGRCWAEVPRHLQRDVMTTWRTYSRLPLAFGQPDPQAANTRKREARLAYRAACDAAVGSIR